MSDKDGDKVLTPFEEALKKRERPNRAPKPGKQGSGQMNVLVKGDKVAIRFAAPVTMITLEAEQAAGLAQAMMQCANAALNNRKVIIIPN